MTCNICFEENTKLINKNCCSLNICESCFINIKQTNNLCPQCKKEIAVSNDVNNSVIKSDNIIKISAKEANNIVQQTEKFRIQEQQKLLQEQLSQRQYQQKIQLLTQLAEKITLEIYEKIKEASKLGLKQITYKKRIHDFGNYDREMINIFDDVKKEFEKNGYNIHYNYKIYTNPLFRLFTNKCDCFEMQLSW